MPWCPKCNAEYQQGFTVCSDCNVALVDSLEEEIELVPFFQADDKKIADKLASFFQYSDLIAEVTYDEENELYLVSIPPKMENQAKKLYQAFYFVERENMANESNDENTKNDTPAPVKAKTTEENTADTAHSEDNRSEADGETADLVKEDGPEVELYDEDELYGEDTEVYTPKANEAKAQVTDEADIDIELEEDPHAYVMKEDKYKDLAGTVGIFLFFGIAGLIFVLLNVFGILTVLNGWLPNTIMGALFLFFLYVGISTNQKAKTLQSEIAAENQMTEKINEWFQEHFTEEFITTLYNNAISEELNYIKITDTVKEMLLKEFGPQNLSYLDRLIEDYYNDNFDQLVI